MRIVEKFATKMKAKAIVSANGIARRGDSNTLVGDGRKTRSAGELTDNPPIGEMIIKDDWIA